MATPYFSTQELRTIRDSVTFARNQVNDMPASTRIPASSKKEWLADLDHIIWKCNKALRERTKK